MPSAVIPTVILATKWKIQCWSQIVIFVKKCAVGINLTEDNYHPRKIFPSLRKPLKTSCPDSRFKTLPLWKKREIGTRKDTKIGVLLTSYCTNTGSIEDVDEEHRNELVTNLKTIYSTLNSATGALVSFIRRSRGMVNRSKAMHKHSAIWETPTLVQWLRQK